MQRQDSGYCSVTVKILAGVFLYLRMWSLTNNNLKEDGIVNLKEDGIVNLKEVRTRAGRDEMNKKNYL